jgi:hypothetical protein
MNARVCIVIMAVLSALMFLQAGCEDSGRFAIAGKTGTLGLGAELSAKLASDINARIGYNTLDFDFDDEEFEDVEYDLGVDFSSFSALADWYIFDNSFRLSGGVMSMDNNIDMKGRPTASQEIGGTTYTASEIGTLKGQIDVDCLAPYLGIGWGNPFAGERRWGFTFDLGAAFTSSPDVKLSANGTLASDPTFRANLEKERQDVEDDIDFIKIYPVISLGFYLRF